MNNSYSSFSHILKLFIFLVFIVVANFSIAQSTSLEIPNQNYCKEIRKKLPQTVKKIDSLIAVDVDSAFKLVNFLLTRSSSCLTEYDKSLLTFTLAKVELEKSELNLTIKHCLIAQSIITSSSQKNERTYLILLARIKDVLSLVNIYQGKMDEAAKYAIDGLSVFEKSGDKIGIANANNRLGIIYMSKGDFAKGELFMRTCIRLNYAIKDSTNGAIGLHMMGYSKNKQHMYDSAMFYFETAKGIFERHNDLIGISKELIALGNTAMDKAMISSPAEKNRLISAALNYVNKAVVVSKKLNDKRSTIHTLKIVFNISQTLNSGDGGLQYLDSALSLSEEIDSKVDQLGIYKMYVEYFKSKNDYKKAFEYNALLKELNDTIWSNEKNKQIEELNLKYETEKKNNQILGLEEKQREQELANAKTQFWLVVTIAGVIVAVLAILIVVVLFKQFRVRSITKNLQLEQKMLRSQMNPHFIFNSLSGIQNFIVQDNTKDAEKYLGRFSGLMRLILENSRNDFISLDNEIKTIDNYLALQKLRFENLFSYELKVSSDLNVQEIGIPPMLSQPFIENAIEHGIRHMQKGGFIEVTIHQKDNQLLVSIKDNGVGREKSKEIEKGEHKKHISQAISITKERVQNLSLQLKYKVDFEIIDLNDNGIATGTLVKFAMPIQYV